MRKSVRRTIALPDLPGFSADTLLAAGIDESDQAIIRNVLDSYQYTNALALTVLSALLAHFEPRAAEAVTAADSAPRRPASKFRNCRRWTRSIPRWRGWWRN